MKKGAKKLHNNGTFGTSAMSCCIQNSINNTPRSIKTPLKSTLQLTSILEPTWPHFGKVCGAKIGAKLVPNRSKNRFSKLSKKTSTFRIAPGTNFERFWAPRWAQEPPKTFQDSPRPPRGLPKANFRPQIHSFSGSNWLDLGSMWVGACTKLGVIFGIMIR